MTDASTLRRANSVEVADAPGYTLRSDGWQWVHHADDVTARITAEHVIRYLECAGFVLMRAPSGAALTMAHKPSSIG